MLNLEQIQNYFSPQIRENPAHKKYIMPYINYKSL